MGVGLFIAVTPVGTTVSGGFSSSASKRSSSIVVCEGVDCKGSRSLGCGSTMATSCCAANLGRVDITTNRWGHAAASLPAKRQAPAEPLLADQGDKLGDPRPTRPLARWFDHYRFQLASFSHPRCRKPRLAECIGLLAAGSIDWRQLTGDTPSLAVWAGAVARVGRVHIWPHLMQMAHACSAEDSAYFVDHQTDVRYIPHIGWQATCGDYHAAVY